MHNFFNLIIDGDAMADSKKRVLMLLSNPYRPDSRVYNEALTLTGNGYSITIIAWARDGNWPEKETKDGIDIIRVGPRVEGKKHFIRNIRHFWKNAELAASKLVFESIHAHDFDTLPLGARLKKRRKVPLVFDAHEIYAQMIRRDVSRPVASMVQLYENICLKKTDRVITVIDGHVDFYRKKVGDKVTLIMNARPFKEVQDAERNKIRKELGLEGKLSFILIGSLEDGKFVHELIEASRLLNGVKIIIGGYGEHSKLVEDKARNNPNLVYLGYVHPKMIVPYTSAADIVFSVYYPQQPMAVATKFFDAVSAGTPLLVNENGDKTTELVKKYNCGMAIPYDLKAFLKAAEDLKKNRQKMQEMKNNIIALRKEYTWEAMAQRLVKLYGRLLQQ
jgi:glycosyltransferase involved in cell wall biosynthesis